MDEAQKELGKEKHPQKVQLSWRKNKYKRTAEHSLQIFLQKHSFLHLP